MKKLTILLAVVALISFRAVAQYSSLTVINSVNVSTDTKDKPQSKIWQRDNSYWTVLTQDDGTFLWKLDGTNWVNVLKLSTSGYGRADCKVVGNVTHILLYRGESSHLVSVEYVKAAGTYKLWSERPTRVSVMLDPGVETATIELDENGRMWLASDATNKVNVRWSDAPFTNWSAPVTLATGLNNDDLCAIVALPKQGKIGVIWSNQNGRKFGFKTHKTGTNPANWSADEEPAIKSAKNSGRGIADDHINLAVANDGTLYCAIKTGYESSSLPRIALLIRRPSGSWDDLYEVTRNEGTRPIIIINEENKKLKIIYTASESGGSIYYKETTLDRIYFSPRFTLLEGKYNFASSTKDNYRTTTVIMASRKTEPGSVTTTEAWSVLATDPPYNPDPIREELVAYPNPFIEKSTLRFFLPESGPYSITLQDIDGVHLMDLCKGKLAADQEKTIEIDGSKLRCGVYVAKMQTNHGVKVARLILAR
ncbi:T9SS type A sorting domain-containing protein [Adhaeribacter soli]|uniref:T9SS type A sorting domain-containing protein n=1 Tax=Adhaeribacter soli TaxID=2607655 RepID=A0A5N1J3Q6_9BACT|nr:T9SS type A sorting domain-containing protein [Adhaeribacter soli]KAA9340725.1 T9SS type A sorting domain-containing protein [Adhaeribacter soli]